RHLRNVSPSTQTLHPPSLYISHFGFLFHTSLHILVFVRLCSHSFRCHLSSSLLHMFPSRYVPMSSYSIFEFPGMQQLVIDPKVITIGMIIHQSHRFHP
ncbi:hypothetical protein VIGAN_09096000, partial [Vigna angularis var. angularis]